LWTSPCPCGFVIIFISYKSIAMRELLSIKAGTFSYLMISTRSLLKPK
jgi:hypothetical protein